MSVLLTSNIVKTSFGFPLNPICILPLVEIASSLHENNVGVDFFDAQKLSLQEWVKQIKLKEVKVVLIQVDEAYLQNLKELKQELGKTIIVAVLSNQDLIDTLVFNYGIDYVYYSENYSDMALMLQTLISPFAMFYDHIPSIAYKNGLGELTKTPLGLKKGDLVKINSKFTQDYQKINMPFAYHIDATYKVDILNGADTDLMTDFLKFKNGNETTVAHLGLPASKKALSSMIALLENGVKIENISVYPTCDVVEDVKMYTNIASAINLASEIKKSGFFKRFLLKLKLNKLR